MDMSSQENVRDIASALHSSYELVPCYATLQSIDELRNALAEHITALLSTQPEKLMNILYRFDVSEDKIHEVFTTVFPFDIPLKVADLILERQQQKLVTRQLYSSGKSW
ncbi:MAG: hypothetical protein IPK11_17300 [Ignavibacteria bacterium]|nr:hypothetical protein [Ignavibacteria bacterium]